MGREETIACVEKLGGRVEGVGADVTVDSEGQGEGWGRFAGRNLRLWRKGD